MRTVTPAPGLTLDDDMFDLVCAALAAHAPTLPALTWDQFTGQRSWSNIPDDAGRLSKSELALARTAELTVKVNVWHAPDLRGRGKPLPHNHPWESFVGHVLAGGYSDDRWWRDAGGLRAAAGVSHEAGTGNEVGHGVFHEVTAVHAPGRTVSLMVCGPGKRGDWGHLDVDSGAYLAGQPVPGFDAMFGALNPQLR